METEKTRSEYSWADEVESFERLDKSKWPAGPWNDEPDKVVWRDALVSPFPMMIVRNGSGALCGYVGVPEGHPLFGRDYSDDAIPDAMHNACNGGLTYADACDGHICHAGDEHVWWFGFDCAHSWDLMPAHQRTEIDDLGLGFGATYKTMHYVKNHVESLARTIVEGNPRT